MPEFPVIRAFRESKTPIRLLLRRFGVVKTTIAVTLFAIVLSVIITAAVDFVIDGYISQTAIILSIAAPPYLANTSFSRIFSMQTLLTWTSA